LACSAADHFPRDHLVGGEVAEKRQAGQGILAQPEGLRQLGGPLRRQAGGVAAGERLHVRRRIKSII
jgi:hypothetical protein